MRNGLELTKNQQGIAVFAGVTVVALTFGVMNGDLSLPAIFLSTSPQAMCSSKIVEKQLHKMWVKMAADTTFASAIGIPAKAFPGAAPPKSDVTFVSEPLADEYDRDLHRVTCHRAFTTTNEVLNLAMLAGGQSSLTTSYSVQPGSSGTYVVTILGVPTR